MAWWRLPAAWIRSAPWHARPKTPRCCWKSWRATTRWIRLQSIERLRITARALTSRSRTFVWVWCANIPAPGLDAEVERPCERQSRFTNRWGDGQRHFDAAWQVWRGHLLHYRAVQGFEQFGALRRRALRASDRREENGGGPRCRASALEAAGRHADAEELDNPLVRMYRLSRAEGFGPEVKRRIMLGTYALSAGYYDAYYLRALKVRRLIRPDYDEAFKQVDLIVGPVTARRRSNWARKSTIPWRCTWSTCTRSVPTWRAWAGSLSLAASGTGLPIGLQLQAPPFEEERLLRGLHMFQQATDWHQRFPARAGMKESPGPPATDFFDSKVSDKMNTTLLPR